MGTTNIEVKRFTFLQKLYNECMQDECKFCNAYKIGDMINFDRETIDKIVLFFVHENFIVQKGSEIAITHSGICHVEKVINASMQLPYKLSNLLRGQANHKAKDQIFKGEKTDDIVELLKKDYLLKTEDGLKQKIAKIEIDFIGQGFTSNQGLASNTYCIDQQLKVHFEYNNKLIDCIIKSLEQEFAHIPLENFQDKLLTTTQEEYKKLFSVSGKYLVQNGLASKNLIERHKKQINREMAKTKKRIEIQCAIHAKKYNKGNAIKTSKPLYKKVWPYIVGTAVLSGAIATILILLFGDNVWNRFYEKLKSNNSTIKQIEIPKVEPNTIKEAEPEKTTPVSPSPKTKEVAEKKLNMSPEEIFAEIESRPLFQQEDARKYYAGLKVKWQLHLSSISMLDEKRARIYMFPTDTIGKVVLCSIEMSHYPQLKVVRTNAVVWVSGEIARIDELSISLSNTSLEFEEGYQNEQWPFILPH
jgi:hypothetical protein